MQGLAQKSYCHRMALAWGQCNGLGTRDVECLTIRRNVQRPRPGKIDARPQIWPDFNRFLAYIPNAEFHLNGLVHVLVGDHAESELILRLPGEVQDILILPGY